jgi:hypothetical protein
MESCDLVFDEKMRFLMNTICLKNWRRSHDIVPRSGRGIKRGFIGSDTGDRSGVVKCSQRKRSVVGVQDIFQITNMVDLNTIIITAVIIILRSNIMKPNR